MRSHRFDSSALVDGCKAAWPICLGYMPIGLALGVLAEKAGLTPFQTGMMSLLVYAGGAQFIAVSMIAAAASPWAIILTTFTVNLRHLLMSSALFLKLEKASGSKLALLAYGITDESFAVNLERYRQGAWNIDRVLVVNHSTNLVWIASTMLGACGGRFIPPGALGIDYALSAMFICLLVFQLRGRIYVVTAILSGMLAVLLALLLPGNYYIVLAAVVAAAVGLLLRS